MFPFYKNILLTLCFQFGDPQAWSWARYANRKPRPHHCSSSSCLCSLGWCYESLSGLWTSVSSSARWVCWCQRAGFEDSLHDMHSHAALMDTFGRCICLFSSNSLSSGREALLRRLWYGGLVSWGCSNTVLLTGVLKQWKCIISQLCSPEIRNQGVGKLRTRFWVESFLASSGFWWWLVDALLPSLPLLSHGHLPCVSGSSSFYKDSSHNGLGPTLIPSS